MVFCVIFVSGVLALFYKLLKLGVPITLVVKTGQELAEQQFDQLPPMPEDVVAYIEQESEEWYRQERRARAKQLFLKTNDWRQVLTELRREDGFIG